MKIQAINSAMSSQCCKPIKQVGFEKRQTPIVDVIVDPLGDEDTFKPTDPSTTEQKYDLACRLAAYYKNQYETLLKNGSVVA